MFRFAKTRAWPELVFHVLAHVRATAHLPASVFDVIYVAFVESHAGPASERTLAEDALLLGNAFADHTALARAQLVAQLFDSVEAATEHAATDLDALSVSPDVCASLAPIAPGVELLRCAALLEAPTLEGLPYADVDEADLRAALTAVMPASPTLRRYTILPIRSLRLRGRLMGDEIWCGVPSTELQLDSEHVAWQAAHEATVGEVSRARTRRGERAIEHIAVALMTRRAERAGLAQSHGRWLAHLAEVPGADPEVVDRFMSSDDDALP